MRRPAMTKKRRLLIFNFHTGVCGLCTGQIQVGEAWEIEHRIPWEISRDDSDANCYPAHVKCHKVKTAKDRKDISKVQRMEAKHNGSWPKSRNPLQSRGFDNGRLWTAGNPEDHE